MGKTNGKSKMDPQELDLDHELPPSDETADAEVGTLRRSRQKRANCRKLKAERDTLLDRLARLQAEFENARKRAAREQQEFRDFATADAIKAFCRRSTVSSAHCRRRPTRLNEFRGGVELIYKQLQDALAKLGVRAVPAKGERFDPHVHEAIEMVETTECPTTRSSMNCSAGTN